MASKKSTNPLLATGGQFSLQDSFGVVSAVSMAQPAAPLPTQPAEEDSFIGGSSTSTNNVNSSVSGFASSIPFFGGSTQSDDRFASIGQNFAPNSQPQSVDLSAPSSPPASGLTSPPLSTPVPTPLLPPPPLTPSVLPASSANSPLLFTPASLPQGGSVLPPSSNSSAPLLSKRPVYAPDPFINATPNAAAMGPPATFPAGGMSLGGPQPPWTAGPEPLMPHSYSSLNLTADNRNAGIPTLQVSHSTPDLQHNMGGGGDQLVQDLTYHWFFQDKPDSDYWKPFGCEDSFLIEAAYESGDLDSPIPVDGTRFDVNIRNRVKSSVYWGDQECKIRRCSWFHRLQGEGRWIPFEEDVSDELERQYRKSAASGKWNSKVEFKSGDWVMLHSTETMVYFPTASATLGTLDDWGQVQPSTDSALKPHVVHRGLEGLPDLPDGESQTVDHLCFIVHGIGAACDIKFRSIFEVVDNYRELTDDISSKHFSGARLAGRANRVEFLPVNWHTKLHGEDQGTDERLKPLTLRSIPKLRSFVNDTLLDVLFYTSPIYCQTILDTVCGEINRVYRLFCSRNPGFTGGISVIGHSLGSLILFDLLCGQQANAETDRGAAADAICEEKVQSQQQQKPQQPRWDKDLSMEEVFQKLEITQHLEAFTSQGITMDELVACSEDDLKEAELPLGPRKKLLNYLESRKAGGKSGFQEFQESSVKSTVDYTVGPAGTGQPYVKYPQLDIKPDAFFAFGSPIGMFMAVRGIEQLGNNFTLPTCKQFFNIFHPYDPVAYRIESLVNPDYSELRPVLIPHHKGRKRMHLELKETMARVGTDIKQKVMDSLKAVYQIAGTWTGGQYGDYQQEEADEVDRDRNSSSPTQEEDNVNNLAAKLNNFHRIDYVLQEAPMESFNEYLFALASHLCYWQSEDTCLLVLREIYKMYDIVSDDILEANKTNQPNQQFQSQPGRPHVITPSFGAAHSSFPYAPPPASSSATPSLGPGCGGPPPPPTASSSSVTFIPPPASSSQSAIPSRIGGPPTTMGLPPSPLGPPTSPLGPPALPSLAPPTPIVPSSVPIMTPSSSIGPPSASPLGPPTSSIPFGQKEALNSSPLGPPSSLAADLGPSPLLFNPGPNQMTTPAVSRPVIGGGQRMYQRPLATPGGTQPLGMDPTAPIGDGRPVGPPPKMSFS